LVPGANPIPWPEAQWPLEPKENYQIIIATVATMLKQPDEHARPRAPQAQVRPWMEHAG